MASAISVIDRIDASAISESGGWSSRRLFGTVAIAAFVVYATTALTVSSHGADAFTNAITSWSIARTGSPVVTEFEGLEAPIGVFVPHTPWIVESERGPISQYPPGAALTALPAYFMADLVGVESVSAEVPLPTGEGSGVAQVAPVWIGSLVGAAITALAVAVVALTISDRHGPAKAMWAASIFAFATCAWMVAGMDIWLHGPGMLWVGAGVLYGQRGSNKMSGFAFALAILTRPHLAVVAAGVGIAAGVRDRSVKPVLEIGAISSIGLMALVSYNWWAFGAPSVTGGYSSDFASQLSSTEGSQWTWYLRNIAGGLFDLKRGLFVYSPFILVLLAKLVPGWRRLDVVGRGAALGGVAYLLIQWKANRYSGGDNFWGYRYPLEALTVLVSLGVAAWCALEHDEALKKAFRALVVAAVAFQFLGVFAL